MTGSTAPLMSELEIIRAAGSGSSHALGELYRAHADYLYRAVFRFCDSAEEAQDVVQDVFVGLPEALGRFDADRPLRPWLRTVAVRVALSRSRTARRRTLREGIATLERIARTTLGAGAGQRNAPEAHMHQRLTLDQVLRAMPQDYRTVFLLREVEGYSHAEIAALLDIAEGTVASRLHRAWKHVRRVLRD